MWRNTLVIAVALLGLGAGPCDMFDMEGEEEPLEGSDGGTSCTAAVECSNALTVKVLRADNQAFHSGAYAFEAVVPEAGTYSVECFLSFAEAGLECTLGNVDVLFAQLDQGGSTIWLTLLGAPENAVIAVSYNSLMVGQRALVPVYDEVQPNGDGCPPTCLQAEESMAVESW